ncbi:MAG TPA: aldose 1-epimerase [Rhizomicrobium sp.]|nr:aldose 1-epimerase [Rhizomicrobium sp.]
MITLEQNGFVLEIVPEVGGAITRFDWKGRPVMRPAPQGVTNPLDCCSFPLVPFANRIENGKLEFEGREYPLPLNFGDHPHSLHGHGWQTSWRVETVSRDRAVIAFDHAPDAWPWAYAAEQEFVLADGGLRMRLTMRSRDDKPMPLSLGFHPYFPRNPGSRLTAQIDRMWLSDSTEIPTVLGEPRIDLPHGVVIAKAPFVDNCFTGFHPPARIEQPEFGLEIALKASAQCPYFHVFIPNGTDYFCAEPTTAMPNAFNRPEAAGVTGARILSPAAGLSVEMAIAVRDL